MPANLTIIGLTGSIGCGKTTVSNHFRQLGFKVFDADAAVHKIYSFGGSAVSPIKRVFPEVIAQGAVSRALLSEQLLARPERWNTLEEVVHPLIAHERERFLVHSRAQGDWLVVLDLPLLLEQRQRGCPSVAKVDYVVVVKADPDIQYKRVISRPGMTMDKYEAIHQRQMPCLQKERFADFVVDTSAMSYVPAKAQVAKIVECLFMRHRSQYDRWAQPNPLCPEDHQVKAITFDLDDTLFPVRPPITRALEALYQCMETTMPRSMAAGARKKMRPELLKVMENMPLLRHDFTELRAEVLRRFCRKFGDPVDAVPRAIKTFCTERSKVQDDLYPDVLPCLNRLKEAGYRLGVLSNGNTDIFQVDQFKNLFDFCITPRLVGAQKPSPVPFLAALHATGLKPSQLIHVGDSLESDVKGAFVSGIRSGILLDRNSNGSKWSNATEFDFKRISSLEQVYDVVREINASGSDHWQCSKM